MKRGHQLQLTVPLEHLPPRPRVLAPDLRLAPELAALAIVDDSLRTALVALLAEHPTLDATDDSPPAWAPTLRRARRLVRCALALRDALDDYCSSVFADLGTARPEDDDLPF